MTFEAARGKFEQGHSGSISMHMHGPSLIYGIGQCHREQAATAT